MLALPEPSRGRLERSPLSLVVCQLRHERRLVVSDPKHVLSLHEALRSRYPKLEEQAGPDFTLTSGLGGVQTLPTAPMRGWRMRSDDEKWTAVVTSDFLALETTEYESWSDYSTRLRELLDAAVAAGGPELEQRLGVRMIDRIVHPDVRQPLDWRGRIDPWLLGPICHEGLGSAILTSQQVLQLDPGDGRSILLRHGSFQDEEAGGQIVYMLDHDCFSQRGQAFDIDLVMEEASALHALALQVFQASVTSELLEFFRVVA